MPRVVSLVVLWKNCHRLFVSLSPNRIGITAYGCGHFIFEDNPTLVIHAIVKAWLGAVDKTKSGEVLKRNLDYAVTAANQNKKNEIACRHSQDELNSWRIHYYNREKW